MVERFFNEEQGGGMVEYALVITLVAIAAVVGMTLLGTAVNNWFNSLGGYVNTLAGAVP